MHSLRTIARAAAPILLLPVAAFAQAQYADPGSLAEGPIAAADRVREQLDEAPWRAGRFRLQPRLGLGDLRYIDNVFDEGDDAPGERVSDFTATARAGLDLYLPLGSDGILSAFAHPTYTWWQKNEDLRRFNLSYGAALFGLFNRATTQLVARRVESDRPVNNEFRFRTTIQTDRLGADARFDVRGPWQLFASLATEETTFSQPETLEGMLAPVLALARSEDEAAFGVGYEPDDKLRVDVGWRTIDTRFDDDTTGRSNRSDSPFVEVRLNGNRLQLDLAINRRELEFDNPDLGTREEEGGLARGTVRFGTRTSTALYRSRSVVYSALDAASYFTSEVTGLSAGWGRRGGTAGTGGTRGVRDIEIRAFLEDGSDDYVGTGGPNEGRSDEVTTVGFTVQIPLRNRLELLLGISEIDIDSNLDPFDRTLTVLRSTVRVDLPEFPF